MFLTELQGAGKQLINQGYLMLASNKHLRVRTIQEPLGDEKGYICFKSILSDTDRAEFEYEIPYADAVELLVMAECSVKKIRYKLPEYSADVDCYSGGLIIIEIEYDGDKPARIPYFCDTEVTGNPLYSNINLAKKL